MEPVTKPIRTRAEQIADKKAEIHTKQAELRCLELTLARDTILRTLGEEEWLSSPSRSMVTLSPAQGYERWEVTIFEYKEPQAIGTLTLEDLLGIRSYIDTILETK